MDKIQNTCVFRTCSDLHNRDANGWYREVRAPVLQALRIPLIPTGTEITAVLVVVCFSAGLNVYAAVAMLGLLSRAKFLILPGSLHGIENWYVIGACCLLF